MPKTRPSLGAAKPKSGEKTSKATKTAKGKAVATTQLYSNFLPLPLQVPFPVPVAGRKRAATHYLFVRPHMAKNGDSERTARTLFVANVPADAGGRDLRNVFKQFGVVEDVELGGAGGGGDVLEATVRGLDVEDDSDEDDDDDEQEGEGEGGEGTPQAAEASFMGTKTKEARKKRRKPNTLPASVPDVVPLPEVPAPYGASGMRTALAVFVDGVSVQRVMGYTGAPIEYSPSEAEGLAHYETMYDALRPPLATVKAHADSAMARYDHLHSLLLSSRAKAHGAGALVDEDGFTVVVRGGRYGRTAGRRGDPGGVGVAVASRAAANAAAGKKKGRGAGELSDFYKFQTMDRKRKELANLRARFEDDKRRVDELKRSRRFKPY